MKFKEQFVRLFFLCFSVVLLMAGTGYVVKKNNNEPPGGFKVDDACNLHQGPCLASTESGQSIELSISPDEIPLLQPLDVAVKLKGMLASSVNVVFSGVDIDMGNLNYPLSSKDGSHFSGGASLSVCSQRKMTWRATVVIESQGRRYAVPFLFDTEYRSKFNLL